MKRWIPSAAWVAAICGALVAVVAVAGFVYMVWEDHQAGKEREEENKERVTMSVTRVFDDYATELTEGILSVYWSALVSNNGQQDVSLTTYKVLDVSKSARDWNAETSHYGLSYTSMDQGLWSSFEGPLDLPVVIPAGHSMRIYFRTGLMMDPTSYRKAREAFPEQSIESIQSLMERLYSEGMDIYGNAVASSSQGELTVNGQGQQVFLFEFSTARGTPVIDIAGYYTDSGLGE